MGISFEGHNLESPIIAAVKNLDDLDFALNSLCKKIFLLSGNIFNLREISSLVAEKNKELYINIESIDGFSKDTWGLEYIVKNIYVSGIISDKSNLIKLARDMGIYSIQKIVVEDSYSLKASIDSLKHVRPSAVEIMPGILNKVIERVKDEVKISVIASGLITDKNDLKTYLISGAGYGATSSKDLWNISI